MTKIHRKYQRITPTLSTLNLVLTRRFYSTVDDICYPAYYSSVESVHTNLLAGLTNFKDEVGSRLRASSSKRLYLSCDELRGQLHISALIL